MYLDWRILYPNSLHVTVPHHGSLAMHLWFVFTVHYYSTCPIKRSYRFIKHSFFCDHNWNRLKHYEDHEYNSKGHKIMPRKKKMTVFYIRSWIILFCEEPHLCLQQLKMFSQCWTFLSTTYLLSLVYWYFGSRFSNGCKLYTITVRHGFCTREAEFTLNIILEGSLIYLHLYWWCFVSQ